MTGSFHGKRSLQNFPTRISLSISSHGYPKAPSESLPSLATAPPAPFRSMARLRSHQKDRQSGTRRSMPKSLQSISKRDTSGHITASMFPSKRFSDRLIRNQISRDA